MQGAVRGRRHRTTVPDPAAARPTDLVKRRFDRPSPNRLWVTDFAYVATLSGTAYVAFVIDVYARRIIGWSAASHMRTALVLDALEMAIAARFRAGRRRPERPGPPQRRRVAIPCHSLHRPPARGYFWPHSSQNSRNRLVAESSASVGAV
ncbi:DDE-type integrase/transposase/recombinase [Streptomyces wedmorensis]